MLLGNHHFLIFQKESPQKSMKEEALSILSTAKHLNVKAKDEDDWKPPVAASAVAEPSTAKKGKPKAAPGRRKKKVEAKSRKQSIVKTKVSDLSHSSDDEPLFGEGPRQCYWYQCLNPARAGSKYCSDECGVRLATDRILRVLIHIATLYNKGS